jgi:S1-C subfamily serine protease
MGRTLVSLLAVAAFLGAGCATVGDAGLLGATPMGTTIAPPERSFPAVQRFPLKVSYESWESISQLALVGVKADERAKRQGLVEPSLRRVRDLFPTDGDFPLARVTVTFSEPEMQTAAHAEFIGPVVSATRARQAWSYTVTVEDWENPAQPVLRLTGTQEILATLKHHASASNEWGRPGIAAWTHAWQSRGLHNTLVDLVHQLEGKRADLAALGARYAAWRGQGPRIAAVAPGRPVRAGSGSGFILRNSNFVLTSYHVVKDRSQLTLHLPSGESFTGRVVGQDPAHDLALLELVGRRATVGGLAVALTAPVRIGETVHAIGYPLGEALSRQPSIVSGQVSSLRGLRDELSQFRTTAPINPGNSGGPVLNQQGQIIGIAAAGLVRSEVEAVRFAVKASAAATLLEQAVAATPFDIAVGPAGPLPPDVIFERTAPYVVLIEAR